MNICLTTWQVTTSLGGSWYAERNLQIILLGVNLGWIWGSNPTLKPSTHYLHKVLNLTPALKRDKKGWQNRVNWIIVGEIEYELDNVIEDMSIWEYENMSIWSRQCDWVHENVYDDWGFLTLHDTDRGLRSPGRMWQVILAEKEQKSSAAKSNWQFYPFRDILINSWFGMYLMMAMAVVFMVVESRYSW